MGLQRYLYTFTLLCLTTTLVLCAPPKLTIEREIHAKGAYVSFTPDTDAISIAYVGLSGVEPFPSGVLKDGRTFLLPTGGLKDGRYKFTAIGVKGDEFTRADFTIVIGTSPDVVPTPTPVPVPEPDKPKLDDAPAPDNGTYVAIVYETGNRVTQNQFIIMYGAKVRKWLEANSTLRLIDKDQVPASEPWKDSVSRKRSGVPWLVVISNKKYVYETALPDINEDDFMKLLSKYINK